MLARIRKMQEENEGGFTLIELLVVMIIIGILAAIAIPLFLNQRKNAIDASMKSDVRTLANELESIYTDTQAYPAVGGFVGNTNPVTVKAGDTVRVSTGNTFTYALNAAADAFCVVASNPKGTHNWTYVSSQGGLQPSSVIACPAAY